MSFKIGDRVRWTSQAAGVTRAKTGEIVEVVPAFSWPSKMIRSAGNRNHESYIVKASTEGRKPRRYWPRVSQLSLVPEGSKT